MTRRLLSQQQTQEANVEQTGEGAAVAAPSSELPTMPAVEYAYWCGRFKAFVEVLAGEFPSLMSRDELADAASDALREYEKAQAPSSSAGVSEQREST